MLTVSLSVFGPWQKSKLKTVIGNDYVCGEVHVHQGTRRIEEMRPKRHSKPVLELLLQKGIR